MAVSCLRHLLYSTSQVLQVFGRIGKSASAFAPVVPSQGISDVQEGADETDEGGSKRLLRSQAAAAAADLERDGDLDRTGWHS